MALVFEALGFSFFEVVIEHASKAKGQRPKAKLIRKNPSRPRILDMSDPFQIN